MVNTRTRLYSVVKKSVVPLLFIVIFCGLYLAFSSFYEKVNLEQGPVQVSWDMACHGYWGLKIAHDLVKHDVGALLRDTLAQSDYPFIHSYWLALFFLWLGPTVKAASLASLTAFGMCLILVFFLGREICPHHKNVAGCISLLLLLGSPFYVKFSVLIMLEMIGAFFSFLGILLYCLALRKQSDLLYVLAYITGTLLFFTKYNYGLFFFASILILELSKIPWSYWYLILAKLSSVARARALLKPANLALAVVVSIIILIIASGGFALNIWFIKISCTSLRNPFYIFLGLCFFKTLSGWNNGLTLLRSLLLRRQSYFIFCVVLPILLWFCLPGKLDAFFKFAINRPSEIDTFSLDGLFYYPRIIMSEYFLSGGLCLLVSIFYLSSLLSWKKLSGRIKFLHVYFLMMVLLMTFHQLKIDRVLITVAPLLWIIAGAQAIELYRTCRLARKVRVILVAGIVVYVLTLLPALGVTYTDYLVDRSQPWFQRSPTLQPVIKRVISHARNKDHLAVIGTFNELSPHQVKWNLYLQEAGLDERILFDFQAARLAREIEKNSIQNIITIQVQPDSPYYSRDYARFNAWKLDTITLLQQSPFRAQFPHVQKQHFPKCGITVSLFQTKQDKPKGLIKAHTQRKKLKKVSKTSAP